MDNPINYWYQKYISLKAEMDNMMKEAEEGEITKDNRGNNVVRAGVFNTGFGYGDKVRVIVLKKEDEK